MRRPCVDALLAVGDRSLWLGAAFAWIGFRQIARPVERTVRRAQSTYSLGRSLHVFADAVAWMSRMPLVIVFFSGALISGGSFLVGLYFLLRKAAVVGAHPRRVSVADHLDLVPCAGSSSCSSASSESISRASSPK
jgi:hypothetical protein